MFIIREFPGGTGRYNTKITEHHSCVNSAYIFILSLALIALFYGCNNVNNGFYSRVLNDFDSTSYFIALDIKSPSYRGRAIIENDNLYRFLNKTRGYDKGKYISYMKRILMHNRKLKIKDKDFDLWSFMKVFEIEKVVLAANRGRDNFIANYFNGSLLNYGISDEERNAIINQLFYWGVPARFDPITGNLVIG